MTYLISHSIAVNVQGCGHIEAFQEVIDSFRNNNMAAPVFQIISMFCLSLHTILISANNSLHCDYHANCVLCPEDVLVLKFVCSVSDGAATILWRGSFFNCPNGDNEIVLCHSIFDNGVIKTCNNGAVVAYSTEVTNNSYISQLNVTVSPEMHNGSVECIHDGLHIPLFVVGACTLIPATGTIIIIISIFTTVSLVCL